MSFTDQTKANFSFAARHAGSETVVYRHVATATNQTLSARVTRFPVDELGQILQQAIDVLFSRADLLEWAIDSDTITITGDRAGTYRVMIPRSIELGCVELRACK